MEINQITVFQANRHLVWFTIILDCKKYYIELFSNLKMEILILVLILVCGWFIFKIVLPAVQMTREQLKEIGDESKYAKINDSIVSNAVDKTKLKYLIKKYKKKRIQ